MRLELRPMTGLHCAEWSGTGLRVEGVAEDGMVGVGEGRKDPNRVMD